MSEQRKTETVFTTLDDVKNDVIAALAACGQSAANYDIEAIAVSTHAWEVETDGSGNVLLNTAGFRCNVSNELFWRVVALHVLTPEQRLAANIDKITNPYVREWALTARDMGLKMIFSPDFAEIVIWSIPSDVGLWIKGEEQLWAHENGKWKAAWPSLALSVLGHMKRSING